MDVKQAAAAITALRMPSLFASNLNYIGISMHPNSEGNGKRLEKGIAERRKGGEVDGISFAVSKIQN